MKKLFKLFAVALLGLVLVSCNNDKEVKLPDLTNKTKQEIEVLFDGLKIDVNLKFEFEYNNEIDENVFIKYKEPNKTDDVIKKDDNVTVILSAVKEHLPDLTGKSEAEIKALFANLNLNTNLTFEYEYNNEVGENLFIKYKEPNKVGDVIVLNQDLTIVLSATKLYLPDLTGKTEAEIKTIFNSFNLNTTLKFEYVYDNNVAVDLFVKYKGDKEVNDELNLNEEITILLSAEKVYLPDLVNKDKSAIEDAFDQMLNTLGLTLEFKYSYPTNEENLFISYLEDLNAGDVVLKDSKITILISGQYVLYPEIEGKSTTEVETLFADLFKDYYEAMYKVTFKEQYDASVPELTIISYANDIEVGEQLKDLNNIVVKRSFKTLILPNLRNLKLNEIKDIFEELNIPEAKIFFMPDYDMYVNAGEFIKYGDNLKAGNSFDITKNTLVIYYDLRPILPDLEDLNKHQIEIELNALDVAHSFEYVLDNDFEYDSFAGYKNNDIGDEVTSGMEVVVLLYENDDVNTQSEVKVEEQLMISKYISGQGNNLGIEIYNPTDKEINLEDYYLAIIPSRQYVPNITIQLTGMLPSLAVYVIVNVNASTDLINISDMQTSLMNFGANATIQLRRTASNTYIDAVYNLGNTSTSFDREIFVRKGHLTHGSRDFVYTEWKGYVPEYLSVIGSHPSDGPDDPLFVLIEDKIFQEYGMTKVKYLSAADGDTVYFESLDPRDTTSYSGDSRIRFLIVDTPETQKPGVDGMPYAQVASNYTRNMLSTASEIYIQASVEGGLTETYGRHLALIWANIGTVNNPNWKFLNYELLKAGLGEIGIAKTGNYQNHPIFSNRYLYSWAIEADNYARENKLGLYSGVHKD